MAVKIRLKRLGRRKRPFFRVIAIDSRSRRDGAEIERLGWYDPLAGTGERFQLKEDRILHWLEVGAQPSQTVKNLFSKAGISLKWHLKRNGKSPEEIAAAVEEWEQQQLERQRRREALEAQQKRMAKPEVEAAPATEEPVQEEAPVEEAPVEEAAAGEVPAAELSAEEPAMEGPPAAEAAVEVEAAVDEAEAEEGAPAEERKAAGEMEESEQAPPPESESADEAASEGEEKAAAE